MFRAKYHETTGKKLMKMQSWGTNQGKKELGMSREVEHYGGEGEKKNKKKNPELNCKLCQKQEECRWAGEKQEKEMNI